MLFCHGRGVRIRSGRVGGVPTATVGSTLFRFRARSRSAATETRRRRPTAAAGLVSEIYGLRRGRSSPVVLRRNENAQKSSRRRLRLSRVRRFYFSVFLRKRSTVFKSFSALVVRRVISRKPTTTFRIIRFCAVRSGHPSRDEFLLLTCTSRVVIMRVDVRVCH